MQLDFCSFHLPMFLFSCFHFFSPCCFSSLFIQAQLLSYFLFAGHPQFKVQQNRYYSFLSHAYCYCSFTKVWLTFMWWYPFLKEHGVWRYISAILLYISTVPVHVVISGVSYIDYFGMNFYNSRIFTRDCRMNLFLSDVEVFKISVEETARVLPSPEIVCSLNCVPRYCCQIFLKLLRNVT